MGFKFNALGPPFDIDSDTELWNRADIALIWPDGTGTHATLAAAVADTNVRLAYLMPDQTGATVTHVINNSSGPLTITRPFRISGQGTETSISLLGNTVGNDLITTNSSLVIEDVMLGNCKIAVIHTGGGDCYLRHVQGGDGSVNFVTTLLDNTGGKAYVQNCVVPLPFGTCILSRSSSVSLTVEQSYFILGTGTGLDISAATEQVAIFGCTFFGAFNPAVKITGSPLYVLSRGNFYQNNTVAMSINGTGSGNVFDSSSDICVGGTTHVSINAANSMTYRFREGSFDATKISVGSGQPKVQHYVDQNAGVYASTLKYFTDANNNSTPTIAMNSNAIGMLLSGAGTKAVTLNPSTGQASTIGSLIASSSKTATLNLHGAAGGLNFGNIDLSGGSAITGTIQDSGTYNANFGTVVGTATLNGLIDFQGKYSFNAGNILDGGTVTFGSTTRGAIFQGLVQLGGTVTLAGSGVIFGGVSGANASLIAGASGQVGTVFGQIIQGTSTENISIEGTGKSALASGYLDFTGSSVTGTSFSKATNTGTVCFFSSVITDDDLVGTTVNMQGISSGLGSVCFATSSLLIVDSAVGTYNIKATSSNFGSAIVGCYLLANDGVTGTITATASGNASALVGCYVPNGIVTASGAAAAGVGVAALGGFTLLISQTASCVIATGAVTANVTASGLGSGIFCTYSNGGVAAAATASGSVLFGGTVGGTNAQTNSVQLGVLGTGLRLLLTSSVTTPTLGDIRNDGTYINLYSNGRDIPMFGHNQTLSTNTTSNGTGADTTEDNLTTYSIPANTLNVNGDAVEFDFAGTTATFVATNTKRIRIYYGATVMIDSGILSLSAGYWRATGKVIRTGANTQKYICTLSYDDGTLEISRTKQSTAAETLSGAVTIKCTGQNGAANANDITQEISNVKRVRAT